MVDLLDLLGNRELAGCDKVDVVDSFLPFRVYLLPPVVLFLLQVLVDPGNRFRPQRAKDPIVFQLIDHRSNLAPLFLADHHSEVEARQTGQSRLFSADHGGFTGLTVLKGELAEVLPGRQRFDRLEELEHDLFRRFRVHKFVDLQMQPERSARHPCLEKRRRLLDIQVPFLVNGNLAGLQLCLDHLEDAQLSLDNFPVDVVIVVNDELKEARRLHLRA